MDTETKRHSSFIGAYIIREYYERLYANILGDLEEMDKSLEMCKRAELK